MGRESRRHEAIRNLQRLQRARIEELRGDGPSQHELQIQIQRGQFRQQAQFSRYCACM